jgi:hypothetical protein
MRISRVATMLLCVTLPGALVMAHAQSIQGEGAAPAQGRGQTKGQASDEANKDRVDEVKAGQ